MHEKFNEILDFWFGRAVDDASELALRMPRWFGADDEIDAAIQSRFARLPERALAGELDAWRGEPSAAVALLLVLDQFPRNLFRGDARAYAYDARALEIATSWIDAGHDRRVPPVLSVFGYLPLEHAEDLAAQERCVACFDALVLRAPPDSRETFERFGAYARSHRDIVRRFGRFPHRNAILGRPSSDEESAWLEAGGETFGS